MMDYYEDGGYYPVGGAAQIAESMAELIESGGAL
jgi:phytoene dehydrogenase-like protein